MLIHYWPISQYHEYGGENNMNNDYSANPELQEAVLMGQFRLSYIAPIVNGTFTDSSIREYCKRVTENELTLPNGEKVRYSWKTIEKWASDYRNHGFEALMPKVRSDKGSVRVLSDVAIERIYELKQILPNINATQIHRRLIVENLIDDKVNVCTVQRFMKNRNLKGGNVPCIKDRKAFEEPEFAAMWQADTKYMPCIEVDGVSRRVYNISIIDDNSRMIVGGELFYEDSAVNFQKVLKDAITAYNMPFKLFVDNGAPYSNEQLSLICGELGIVLIHTKVRDGAAKAKIERYWRTLDNRFNYTTDFSAIHSLKEYNDLYRDFIRQYNTSYHNGINCTPYERYKATCDKARKVKNSSWLDECFLNRIKRKVKLDSTVSIDKISYDAPMEFIRQNVEIRFEPNDMSTAFIFSNGKKYPIRATNKNENARTKRSSAVLDYSRLKGE